MAKIVKILVVDDEPLLKSLIEQYFEKQMLNNEMHFVFSSNGIEALEKLKADDSIGVILIDINMPEMDGLTLLDKLNEFNKLYRSVVVSAYGDMKNIRIAMNRGASDFIIKPIDLDDLKITINKTIEQYKYLEQSARAREQIAEFHKELEIAHNIQNIFIPSDFKPFPDNNNVSLYGEMMPAREVGGDFFDFFVLDPQHLAVVIADVSGKGIPAALFMVMSRILIRGVAVNCADTAVCLERVNQLLSYHNETCMFVTAFYGIINIMTGEFHYCNAGHNAPYVLSRDGTLKKIVDSEGAALGVIDSIGWSFYEEKKLILNKEDTLVLYTDGVIEASNPKLEFYGEQRLLLNLMANGAKSITELSDELKKDISDFVKGAEQFDDITFFFLRFNGPN